MRHLKKVFLILFVFAIGCGEPEIEDVFVESVAYSTVPIFTVLENYVTAPLENHDQIHLGVNFIVDTSPLSNQISNFENIAGQHAIFTNTIYLGENLPEMWLWEMLALGRTPNIILQPTNIISPFERVPLRELARQLGNFHMPMFLHIFPEARSHGYHPVYYIDFLRYAREVFRKYAPQIALVFTIYEGDVLDFWDFYPGHDYVDWVAINHYVVLENGISLEQGTLSRLDAFYQSFARYKPVMVSFGVSHFSTANHMYHTLSAGQFLQEFYEEILTNFLRVGAIVYKDINFIDYASQRNNTDNFSISDNQIVLQYYKMVTENNIFSREIVLSESVETDQIIRSSFFAVIRDNKIFLPHNFLFYQTNLSGVYLNQYLLPHRKEIMDQIFYNSHVLLNLGLDIQLKNDRIIINF